ncbi:glycoside hydrolase family 3 C-terminal domain-containing protein [Cohnella thailandensis]|uniref:Glycoside hydrolase family 3 C-terminal domain-containing protein n=2 Tax=Cohnella thailandensis TaxID=557557 RepID=A0A841SY78_9BACL|nr:glycoside hydrolase family 3 C-terminal domain-containing protein [Cohnella thailandensis]
MVLLENDGALPLRSKPGNIALYGNGARHTVKGGTGSGEVNSRVLVTIEQGLEAAGIQVTTKSWLDEYERRLRNAKQAYADKLEAITKERGQSAAVLYYLGNPFKDPRVQAITPEDVRNSDADVAIYVLARNSGEGKDRTLEEGDYRLAEEELEAIRVLARSYDTFIVLLNIGGIVDTTELRRIQGINAVMLIGQLGNVTGYSVADALLGLTIPSGKLTDTWAASYSDYPSSDTFSHVNGELDDEYYKEGIYVGYRYFDTFDISPNYCFGYGRSYTDFSLHTLDVTADEKQVAVTVEVTNAGKLYFGREVVQVYYSAPAGEVEKPYQELAAFAKTKRLAPGESEVLTVSFATNAMASYRERDAAWVLESGTYYVRVGNHSRNTKVAAGIHLPATVKTVQLKNLFHDEDEVREIRSEGRKPYSYASEPMEKQNAKIIPLDPSGIDCETAAYQSDRPVYQDNRPDVRITMDEVRSGSATPEELVAQLSVQEMAELCVGTAREGSSIIGASAGSVPGAGGQTFPLAERGISSLVMADGPAGLRLQPHFRVSKDGELLPGGEMFGDNINPLPEEAPEGAVDYYQYCTAIPIATSLAQSWDMDMIERVGQIVGREMRQFHVHLWLAPGMNIHRNPLCGRNFEYYSEDPLLTGKCAAAETRGVQAYPGQGTTLKHFAANNQEDNRMFTNAHVGERALREIYLKGFEIAVKESNPLAIMTSYNLLNGMHAANHYELIQSVARDEWGFEGIVVSDWYTSMKLFAGERKYPISSSPLCIKAGNDVQMPGCRQNIDDIIAAVDAKEGEAEYPITLGDLQFCALNMIKVIARIP